MASFEHVRQADRSVAADADDLAGVTVLPIYTTKRIGPDYPPSKLTRTWRRAIANSIVSESRVTELPTVARLSHLVRIEFSLLEARSPSTEPAR